MNTRLQNSARTFRLFILAVPVLLTGTGSLAQESGWYAGLSGGWADTDVERDSIIAALQTDGYTTSQFDSDDNANAYKILGGYSVNRYFGFEASYFDLGTFDFNAELMPSAMQGGRAAFNGVGLDLVGTLPLQNRFTAFVKAGINSTRVEQDFTSNQIGAGLVNHSDTGVHGKIGAGLQYRLNDVLLVRAELERYGVDDNRVTDNHVDTFTVGVVYRFGSRQSARPVTRAAEPAPTPAPTPVPAPQPAPPPVELTLSANTLFDFDRAVLKAEGREALDRLVADMEDLNYEVVIVTGHTDRIGTRDYNLGLSQRRAATVRNYLVQAGVPDQRITARGVNSDEPVTRPQQCTGPVSDALKACLQPDRRVVVEVTGTRDTP